MIDDTLAAVMTELLPGRSTEHVVSSVLELVDPPRGAARATEQILAGLRADIGGGSVDGFLWRLYRAYHDAGGRVHDLKKLIPLLRPREIPEKDRLDLFRHCLRKELVHLLDLSSEASFRELFGLIRKEKIQDWYAQEILLGYLEFMLRERPRPADEEVYGWFVDAQELMSLDSVDPSRVNRILGRCGVSPGADPLLVAFLYRMLRPRFGSVVPKRDQITAAARAAAGIGRLLTRRGGRQGLQQTGRLVDTDVLLSDVLGRFHRDERYHRLLYFIRLAALSSERRQDLFRILLRSPVLRGVDIPSEEVFDDLMSAIGIDFDVRVINNIRPAFQKFVGLRARRYRDGYITLDGMLRGYVLWTPLYGLSLELLAPEILEEDMLEWITFLSTINTRFFSENMARNMFMLLRTAPEGAVEQLKTLLTRTLKTLIIRNKITPEELQEYWRSVAATDRAHAFLGILRGVLDTKNKKIVDLLDTFRLIVRQSQTNYKIRKEEVLENTQKPDNLQEVLFLMNHSRQSRERQKLDQALRKLGFASNKKQSI
jgi:uncharacterized protein YajQ (UPF0234 family)